MDDAEIAHGSRAGRAFDPGLSTERPAGGSADELLSPSEFDVWRVFVASSRLLVAELDRRLRHEAGIPHSWFILLVVLAERPDRTARQSDLASITDFSLSRLSHAINRMQDKGWMYRRTDPDDRRAADVVLTPLGAAAVLDIRRGHDAELRRLFFERLVDRDIEALRRACRALLPGLRGASQTLAAGPPQGP
jgi:DNA-binding MarR family transcriptional regulator